MFQQQQEVRIFHLNPGFGTATCIAVMHPGFQKWDSVDPWLTEKRVHITLWVE